ncbi:MAG: DNA alkylation repair protein [Bacteroidales bacterium]|nr:DNA alkylation repair protein [Bacteroidales bacterium]
MTDIQKQLFELQDKKYAEFQCKLTPGITLENCIGVRIPEVRKIAKSFIKSPDSEEFMNSLPHKYYDENILHSKLISEIKDFDYCIKKIEQFLPYMDNWAVCDTCSPKILKKNKVVLIDKIRKWSKSKEIYTCRFGIEMLQTFFLDEDFKPEYLEIPVEIISEEYYINMMIAWFFATALAKQWDSAIKIIEDKKLSIWVHNKTIQKAIESYRISDENKQYLRTLKL